METNNNKEKIEYLIPTLTVIPLNGNTAFLDSQGDNEVDGSDIWSKK